GDIRKIREVKRIGYARYLKNAREEYRDMFVSKTRFRCVKKVRGERRCDIARKERTKSKVCAVAEFILQNLKKRKGVRKFMTKDGRFKINLRSEEHTSELQSRFDLVCRLLLEKKNKEISEIAKN